VPPLERLLHAAIEGKRRTATMREAPAIAGGAGVAGVAGASARAMAGAATSAAMSVERTNQECV
jgi:hypothetical protein